MVNMIMNICLWIHNFLPDPYSRRIIINGRTRIEVGPGGVSTADDFNWESSHILDQI